MISKGLKSLALASMFIAASFPAPAITVSFSGTIYSSNSMSGDLWGLESLIPIGTTFTDSFSYDPKSEAIWHYSNPEGTETRYIGTSFVASVGPMEIRSETHILGVIDGAYAGLDQFVADANIVGQGLQTTGSPIPVFEMGVGMYDSTQSAFSDGALPPYGIDGSEFDERMFTLLWFRNIGVPSDAYVVNGTIDYVSSVPEPTTFLLFSTCLFGLWLVGNRRRVLPVH